MGDQWEEIWKSIVKSEGNPLGIPGEQWESIEGILMDLEISVMKLFGKPGWKPLERDGEERAGKWEKFVKNKRKIFALVGRKYFWKNFYLKNNC